MFNENSLMVVLPASIIFFAYCFYSFKITLVSLLELYILYKINGSINLKHNDLNEIRVNLLSNGIYYFGLTYYFGYNIKDIIFNNVEFPMSKYLFTTKF